MSTRDELAVHLTKRMGVALAEPLGWIIPATVLAPVIAGLAADLDASGYRKPRTISNEAELDKLPAGSVVLSETYRHYANGTRIAFQLWNDGRWYRGARSGDTHPDNFLPATVLHEPGVK